MNKVSQWLNGEVKIQTPPIPSNINRILSKTSEFMNAEVHIIKPKQQCTDLVPIHNVKRETVNTNTRTKTTTNFDIRNFVRVENTPYCTLEICPSKLTSNTNVRWLMTEFSRIYKPFFNRIGIRDGKFCYTPEMSIWWEIFLHKDHIKFYLSIPNMDYIKNNLIRQVMKTWKQSNVKEIRDFMPQLNYSYTNVTKLTLQNNTVLSLDTDNPTYTPLESLLNAKYYLKDEDVALLQIGMIPQGESWNQTAEAILDDIKQSGVVPRKRGKSLTLKDSVIQTSFTAGKAIEGIANLLGDLIIPGWEQDSTMIDMDKKKYGESDSRSTRNKVRSEAFSTVIRVVSQSTDSDRRRSIIRALVSGFDPLEGDNKLIEQKVPYKKLQSEIQNVMKRQYPLRNPDILCSLELSRIINVPDQKAQIEHYNELSLVNHRSEADVPKHIFEDDGTGVPFALYEDTDGIKKTVFFNGKNKNLFCMPTVVIGEPGTGKTTHAVSFALDAFNRKYGGVVIDAADGKMVQRILDRIRPDQKNKVKVIDLMNTQYPIGLGWNEIFKGRNSDVIEDLIVEEIITYIELVSATELNMRSRQWVENAVKAVFTTPDATLQDVENMINNAQYRSMVIPTIDDPELRKDWEYYHNKLTTVERKTIYDEAFRRISPVIRKKALKKFILQKPKKNEDGSYAVDFRKWMDEGYLILIKANETLGPTLQTALVSFIMAKFNLAMISREDITDEDDRPTCFLILDEPDHYIKGSERWRNMLTRYRKYRCKLLFMFHGWQQLVEMDKSLPKIIRKSGPHYVIYQTDEENLLELKTVIEPEFKIADIAKGMPQFHAVIRLKMYGDNGETLPAFMAKSIDEPERRYGKDKVVNSKGYRERYNNDDLYEVCAKELGRPEQEVVSEIYNYRSGADFDISDILRSGVVIDGEGDLDTDGDKDIKKVDEEEKIEKDRRTRRLLEYKVGEFIQKQLNNGEEPDLDLITHMEEVLEDGNI